MKPGDGINLTSRGRWTFSENTPLNFDSHVKKSLPLYSEGHGLICDMLPNFLRTDSTFLEVGCSTGTLTEKLAITSSIYSDNVRIIGIDPIDDMCNLAATKCSAYPLVEIVNTNLEDFDLPELDLTVLYFTLQFIASSRRLKHLKRIYESTRTGGGVFLFEKTYCEDGKMQDLMSLAYDQFKLNHGYDMAEIQAKRLSLRGVLEPLSSSENIQILKDAGFSKVEIISKYLMFEGYLAFK